MAAKLRGLSTWEALHILHSAPQIRSYFQRALLLMFATKALMHCTAGHRWRDLVIGQPPSAAEVTDGWVVASLACWYVHGWLVDE